MGTFLSAGPQGRRPESMDGRDHVRRAIRHYLEKDEDLHENPEDQTRLCASIQAAFILARAAVSAARDVRDMAFRLPPYLEGRASALHRHYDAVWSFLGALWELIDFCELEQDVATSDVEDPVWFFGRALDQHLGGNSFETLSILDEAGLTGATADPWVQMLRAEALAATGDQVAAIGGWEEAVRLDPLLAPAHVSAAGELEALGRDRDAYGHWLAVKRAVSPDEPIAAEANRHLVRLRQRLGSKPPAAGRELSGRLPRWGPSWVPTWPGLGRRTEPSLDRDPADSPPTLGEAAVEEAEPTPTSAERTRRPGLVRGGKLQAVLGLGTAREKSLCVCVVGADPVGEGILRSRSAVYLGGGCVVGSGTAGPDAVGREEPDIVVLASGIGAEHCAALAERVRAGTLRSPSGETSFIYNGPAEMRGTLDVIFKDLPIEFLPDICPPLEDPDLAWAPPAGDEAAGAPALPDGLVATRLAIERRTRERLGGKHAARAIFAQGGLGLASALEWLDGAERRHDSRIPPYDLIAVRAEPEAVEAVAVRGLDVMGHSFAPGGEDRGRLLEELFDELPRVLAAGDTALLMGRLLGEGGPLSLADGPESFVAASLAGGVLARAMLGLRQALAVESSYAVRASHLVVGGSLLSRLPNPEHALLAAIDGCQPTGVTRVLLDPYGILSVLGDGLLSGRLAPDDPSWADGTASLLAGSCVSVAPLVQAVNWGKPGRKLVLEATVKGAWRDGERAWQLFRGELIWVPLPAGRRVELAIRPAVPHNVGRGRGVEWRGEFIAGGLGLLLDGRGRPFRLPADEIGRTTLRAAWASEVVGRARGA